MFLHENALLEILYFQGRTSKAAIAEKISESLFKVTDKTNDSCFAVKIVEKESGRGSHGILEAYQKRKRLPPLVQPVFDLSEQNGYIIALLDWIDGTTLRQSNRSLLPEFFKELKSWHEKNMNDESIYSPYTETEYETISEFVYAEASVHLEAADLPKMETRCMNRLNGLHNGFITLTHGDVHPGNILSHEGRYFLLDPEFVHNGINVLDLEYIHFGDPAESSSYWWNITEFAEMSTKAYFGEAVSDDRVTETMKSVHILTSLRGISNSIKYKTGNTEESVNLLLEELKTDA